MAWKERKQPADVTENEIKWSLVRAGEQWNNGSSSYFTSNLYIFARVLGHEKLVKCLR